MRIKLWLSTLCLLASFVSITHDVKAEDVEFQDIGPTNKYLAAMSTVFHNEGKLMARVLLDATGTQTANLNNVQLAAAYIVEKLTAIKPPADFQSAHEKLCTTFNVIAKPGGDQVLTQIMITMNNPNPQQALSFLAGAGFSEFDDAITKARRNKSAAESVDPWYAAGHNTDGKPNTADSSSQFGLNRPIEINKEALSQIDPSYAKFFEAVGAKSL